jgi:hypothetical protein
MAYPRNFRRWEPSPNGSEMGLSLVRLEIGPPQGGLQIHKICGSISRNLGDGGLENQKRRLTLLIPRSEIAKLDALELVHKSKDRQPCCCRDPASFAPHVATRRAADTEDLATDTTSELSSGRKVLLDALAGWANLRQLIEDHLVAPCGDGPSRSATRNPYIPAIVTPPVELLPDFRKSPEFFRPPSLPTRRSLTRLRPRPSPGPRGASRPARVGRRPCGR